MTSTTRSDRDIYLIGLRDLEPLLRYRLLPTIRQVLQRFHQHLKENRVVRNASHLTIEEVMVLWERAAIPTTLTTHAIKKLERCHTNWLKLKKNKGCKAESQRLRETEFSNQLDVLFDIASSDALKNNSSNPLQQNRIDEDRKFITDQRSDGKCV